jgi:hypothetical protein
LFVEVVRFSHGDRLLLDILVSTLKEHADDRAHHARLTRLRRCSMIIGMELPLLNWEFRQACAAQRRRRDHALSAAATQAWEDPDPQAAQAAIRRALSTDMYLAPESTSWSCVVVGPAQQVARR